MIAAKDRQCVSCQRVKPLTPKHFRRYGGENGDFKTTCKSCEQKAQSARRMDRIERKAVDHMLASVAIGGSNIPHTAELLESIMHYFGGANGFASMLLKQYFESPPGSRIRTSVLEMIVRLASKNTEQGGAKKPIQLYSEEELEQEIDNRIRQVASLVKTGGKVINVKASEAGPQQAEPAAIADDQGPVGLSVGRTEGPTGGIEVEAARSLAVISADAAAAGIPQLPRE